MIKIRLLLYCYDNIKSGHKSGGPRVNVEKLQFY